MSDPTTTNYGWAKPIVNADADVWGTTIDANYDSQDTDVFVAATGGLWAVAGGSVNAITATFSPVTGTLRDGMTLGLRALGANTSTTPTFAPDGGAARLITRQGGVALNVGDIPAPLAEIFLRYNLAHTRWELVNPASPFNGKTVFGLASAATSATQPLADPSSGILVINDSGPLGTASTICLVGSGSGTSSAVVLGTTIFGGTTNIASVQGAAGGFTVTSKNTGSGSNSNITYSYLPLVSSF